MKQCESRWRIFNMNSENVNYDEASGN
jgi:hypothetical protein